ncbi:MAG: serine hydrolase domain-containing protein [Acidobacteriota bacterium]
MREKRLRSLMACILLGCFMLMCAAPAMAYTDEQITNDFGSRVNGVLNDYNIPSLQACIIKKDPQDGAWYPAWRAVYGISDNLNGTGQKQLANEDTIYPICSLTKSIVAAAIMKLTEPTGVTGKVYLNLDEDVNDILFPNVAKVIYNPDYNPVDNPAYKITVRQLLTHRSGIVDDKDLLLFCTDYTPYSPYGIKVEKEYGVLHDDNTIRMYFTAADSNGKLKAWRHLKINNRPAPNPFTGWVNFAGNGNSSYSSDPPNSVFCYSDVNYMLLGSIIEKKTGIPWQQYIKDNILEPLHMHNTRFYWREYPAGNLSLGYMEKQFRSSAEGLESQGCTGYVGIFGDWRYTQFGAGGNMKSTANDMAHFMSMMINSGEFYYKTSKTGELVENKSVPILTRQSVAMMKSYNVVGGPEEDRISINEYPNYMSASGLCRITNYGLGWQRVNWGGRYWSNMQADSEGPKYSVWNNNMDKNVNWTALEDKGVKRTITNPWGNVGGLYVDGHYGDQPGWHCGMYRINIGEDQNESNDVAMIYMMNESAGSEFRDQSNMRGSTSVQFNSSTAKFSGEYDLKMFTINPDQKPMSSIPQDLWLAENAIQQQTGMSMMNVDGALSHWALGKYCEIEHLLVHKAAIIAADINL